MSFQDVGPPLLSRRDHRPNLPKVTAAQSPLNGAAISRKQYLSMVARRRAIRKQDDDLPDVTRLGLSSASSDGSREEYRDDLDAIRELQTCSSAQETHQRKSTFAKLTHETQLFQKLVADLEMILNDAGETPEAAWRARILVKSAQDTDKGLWDKLDAYEKLLLSKDKYDNELHTAQTACMKLHRDFKRSHKALVECLSLYETRQKVEVSQLGAVGWSGHDQEDFFERAMRQRELERMNESMRQVNDIFTELAGLVEGQQRHIDLLEDDIDFAAANVEAGADEIHCYGKRGSFMCGAMDDCSNDETDAVDTLLSIRDDKHLDGMRVSEKFHWYMPFETLKEDMASVKDDILMVGKDIVSKGKRLECGDGK
jgi:hypothetical protein